MNLALNLSWIKLTPRLKSVVRAIMLPLALAVTLGVGLSACSNPSEQFQNTDLTGLDYAKDFALTDHNGSLAPWLISKAKLS